MSEPRAVEIYASADGAVSLEVHTEAGAVWLNRHQLSALFGRDVKTIGKHIANALREELAGSAVVAKFATTAADGKTYRVEHYGLDMVLSVGYRVKSAEGVRFRTWASDVLKRYLVDGAAVNEARLQRLGQIVQVLARSNDDALAGVAEVLAGYLPGLIALRDYDAGSLGEVREGSTPSWKLTYDDARAVIDGVHINFPDDVLFGNERGDSLRGIVETIYQAFAGHELYPSVQQKAANLLYLVVKDHPLSDGNKRSAAALFVYFLACNGELRGRNGAPRISNTALTALTLMIAMSDPKEKELMISLVTRLLVEDTAS